jgi:hypothetical protein
MTNATTNQILDNSNAADTAAPVVAKKAPLFKKLAQFQTPDGRVFETQKEASEHIRGYLVVDAVNALAAKFDGTVVNGDGETVEQTLGEFLLANKADMIKAYDAAKVERAPVTEETKEKMRLARAAGAAKKALAAAPVEPAAEVASEVQADAGEQLADSAEA